jgi:hypothetical protein
MKCDMERGRLEMRHAFFRQQIYGTFGISTEIKANTPYCTSSSPIQWSDSRHLVLLNNFRSIVGSCIYDANTCCPFVFHPLSILCARMHAPEREDALKLDQFMCFMAGHIDTPYIIQRPTKDPSPNLSISSFTDFSFADLSDYRRVSIKRVIFGTILKEK